MNSQVSLASTELERNPGRVNFFKIDENGRVGGGGGGGVNIFTRKGVYLSFVK